MQIEWLEELRSRYLAGETNMFLLHGNVRDLHGWREDDGTTVWLTFRAYLEKFLHKTRDVVGYYDVSRGLQFSKRSSSREFRSIVDARRSSRGDKKLDGLPVLANESIPVIDDLLGDKEHSSAVIVDYCEMIAPNTDLASMMNSDKSTLTSLQRWVYDPAISESDNLVVFVTENIADVSRKLSATVASIQVPFPSEETRLRFIQDQDLSDVKMEFTVEVLAKMTAGLTLMQIRHVLRSAARSGEPIDFYSISLRKKRIIEQECNGLVEFVPPKHNFTHVGGMESVKADLLRIADAIRRGNRSRVPMGVILTGPPGTGKTFVAEAFATESGLTCLKLKNFRDKWVGSTEANLEKVLGLVDALGYVLLIIDEADRGLAGGDAGDGVGSRVIARLKEFMSDTSHRGKVIIVMMTNRPDKLDTDLKRPGRFDVRIPFFYPETAGERAEVLQAVARKNKLVTDKLSFDAAAEATEGYSAAEIEAVMLAAAAFAGDTDGDVILQEHLDNAVKDIIPSRDTRMLSYMELLAVFECSAKRMLPERYQSLTTDEIQQKLDELRLILGRRAI